MNSPGPTRECSGWEGCPLSSECRQPFLGRTVLKNTKQAESLRNQRGQARGHELYTRTGVCLVTSGSRCDTLAPPLENFHVSHQWVRTCIRVLIQRWLRASQK